MKESVLWKASPSQVTNLSTFIWCGLFCFLGFPIFYGIYKWLLTKSQVFEITSQRVKNKRGILSKTQDQIELYRVRDYRYEQPIFLRIFGLGNIILETSDKSHPKFVIPAIANPEALLEIVREHVEACRTAKNVREVDVA